MIEISDCRLTANFWLTFCYQLSLAIGVEFVYIPGRVHPAFPSIRLSDYSWNRFLGEWEDVVTPTHRRELVLNESMFRIQPGSDERFSRLLSPSKKSPFLPTSLDGLDLSVGVNQLSTIQASPSFELATDSSVSKKKKTGKGARVSDSLTPTSPSREGRLLSEYLTLNTYALSFTE